MHNPNWFRLLHPPGSCIVPRDMVFLRISSGLVLSVYMADSDNIAEVLGTLRRGAGTIFAENNRHLNSCNFSGLYLKEWLGG